MPSFFNSNRAAVLGVTINKYNYVSLNLLEKLFEKKIKFSYSKLEYVNEIEDLQDIYLKEILLSILKA